MKVTRTCGRVFVTEAGTIPRGRLHPTRGCATRFFSLGVTLKAEVKMRHDQQSVRAASREGEGPQAESYLC
jgi:hypothetical protein